MGKKGEMAAQTINILFLQNEYLIVRLLQQQQQKRVVVIAIAEKFHVILSWYKINTFMCVFRQTETD